MTTTAHRIKHQNRHRCRGAKRARVERQQSAFAHACHQRARAQPKQPLRKHLLHGKGLCGVQHPHLTRVWIHPQHAARGPGPRHAIGAHHQRVGTQLRIALGGANATFSMQPSLRQTVLLQGAQAADPQRAIVGFGDGRHGPVAIAPDRLEALARNRPAHHALRIGGPYLAITRAQQLP